MACLSLSNSDRASIQNAGRCCVLLGKILSDTSVKKHPYAMRFIDMSNQPQSTDEEGGMCAGSYQGRLKD